jgi:hypothetical protein
MALDLELLAKEISMLFVSITEKDASDYKKLQLKLISCNANQDILVKRITEVEPIVAKKQNEISTKKFALNARKQDIKANTANVKKLTTGKERDEAAEEILHNDYKELLNMENDLNDWTVAKNALITTLRKLKTTEQNIKLLKSMLDEQVNKLNIGSTGDPDVAHLQNSLSELDDLDSEVGLDDDVESSEEFIEDSEEATHDESEQPSIAPLDSQDSHDAFEGLSNIDGLDEFSDESEQPSIAPLDSQDSREDLEESEKADIESLIDDGGIDFDPYDISDDDDFDDSPKDTKEVTAKQPPPKAVKDESKTGNHKRTAIEEVLNEDLPEDKPAVEEKIKLSENDVELDMSDLLGDYDLTSNDQEEESDTEEVETEAVIEEPLSESSIVEDEASVGEEYDIESLLDM